MDHINTPIKFIRDICEQTITSLVYKSDNSKLNNLTKKLI